MPDEFASVSCEEKEFYKTVANILSKCSAPDTVNIDTDGYGSAEYQLVKKGGAFFVKENYNYILISENDVFEPVYLVMVNPEWNNYKFYQLEDLGNGTCLATYGRIGAGKNEVFGERTHLYPKRMFWIKLLEKLGKGYKDMTDIYLSGNVASEETEAENNDETDKNAVSYKLFVKLKAFSTNYVAESCISSVVTLEMCEKAEELLNKLYAADENVNEFNKVLVELLGVSPRRVRNVADLLAVSDKDYANIISREETLLLAMQAVAGQAPVKKAKKKTDDGFANASIEVYIATEKQKTEVLNHLSDNLKPLVKNVYRVIHPEHKKRFNAYLKKYKIKEVKQLWHGSRNPNWCSIVQNGLQLHPNAQITGKMFGHGIYFAPSSQKSWGYTSYHNTYWAGGNSDTAFMGLYACAYGKPKDIVAPNNYNQKMLDDEGCNCIHAHAGTYLYNDEIVFYNEDCTLLNYVVEFGKAA